MKKAVEEKIKTSAKKDAEIKKEKAAVKAEVKKVDKKKK